MNFRTNKFAETNKTSISPNKQKINEGINKHFPKLTSN